MLHRGTASILISARLDEYMPQKYSSVHPLLGSSTATGKGGAQLIIDNLHTTALVQVTTPKTHKRGAYAQVVSHEYRSQRRRDIQLDGTQICCVRLRELLP